MLRGRIFVGHQIHLFFHSQLLQLDGCILDKHHVSGLNKSIDQFLTKARQLVVVDDGKAERGRLLTQLDLIQSQEVDIRWESAKQIQDVVTAIIADDAFALNRRTEQDLAGEKDRQSFYYYY